VFSAKAGTSGRQIQTIDFPQTYLPLTIATNTTAGGNWLAANLIPAAVIHSLTVTVDPSGLATGIYQGTVSLTSAAATNPAIVAVTLYIWKDPPPPVTVTPSSLMFTMPSGGSAPFQTVRITTAGLPLPFSNPTSTADGHPWLFAGALPDILTPATVNVGVNGTLAPGVYHGVVTVAAPAGSSNVASIPVTLTVTPAPPPVPLPPPPPPPGPPFAATVINAASLDTTSVSPGEIITIFGLGIGPSTPAGLILDATGKVATTLSGTRVFFNGLPAPILYTSATQINTIVPYEGAAKGFITIEVEINGARIPASSLPVAPAAPSIFTLDATGQGRAAVLNQDNSVNSPTNPAPRGSIIQIYATGEGTTSPPSATGQVTGAEVHKPALPVSATIAGIDAPVQYAAEAPQLVSGVLQANVLIPSTVAPGSTLPLVLTIGNARSQDGVTIAVK
jgi:uncharacterized protein (TIGR03437 family)